MFKRRDIPPVLLLLLLIILVMLTLSQILVVHNGRYGRNIRTMRKLQLELREMDINLHSLMLRNVPSIELNRRLLQNQINAHRIAAIIEAAAEPHQTQLDSSLASSIRHSSTSASATTVDNSVSHSHLNAHQSSTFSLSYRTLSVPQTYRTLARPKAKKLSPRRKTGSINGSVPSNTKQTLSQIYRNVPSQTRVGPGRKLMKYCPAIPPSLKGRVFVNFAHAHNYTEEDIIAQNPEVLPGGQWRPRHCAARHKVAIIVPYRDRHKHLCGLLSHLHPILQRQQLDYRIYVVEQSGIYTFNKARIMNIAFVEALKQYQFECFVFHDVDLVPEDDRNMYSCPLQPRHMSVAIDEMGYKLAYQELVGGVLNMRAEHFQRVNGYSNLYWGWGAEDDDMAYRIMHVGLKITRPPEAVARYKMIKHTKRKPADWRKRAKLLLTGTRRFQFDGLNSLQYKVVHIKNQSLFTHLLVDIGKPLRGF